MIFLILFEFMTNDDDKINLNKLRFKSKADLRKYLKNQQKKDFQTGTQAIRSIREENH